MQPLSLYIHWPFCKSKCPYCDFNSHVRDSIDENYWENAYMVELKRNYDLIGDRQLKSVFFGGGTPSLMSPGLVGKIIEKATTLWQSSSDIEITVEANPTSIEVDKFKEISQVGVNRVSIGVQSFNADDLKFLGREHSADEARRAIHIAQETFKRVSFDLIYARPRQDLVAWQQELEFALSFGTEHLSLYQLTIEQGTAFATKYARQEFSLPEENLAADLYEMTINILSENGLYIYEISNFSKQSQESKHNLAYWTYQDYLGIGPGAHGRITLSPGSKYATRQFKAPEKWLEEVQRGSGMQESVELSLREQATEKIMMGLRLFQPFDLSSLSLQWNEIIDENRLSLLKKKGLIQQKGNHLELTTAARLCLNEMLRYIILA